MNLDSLRLLYIQYGGSPHDAGEDIGRELGRESKERQRIVAETLDGVSMRDLGRRMGVEGGSVRSRLELTVRAIRKRIEMNDTSGGYVLGANENRLPDDVRAEARRLASEGMERKAICAQLGVSKASLSRWLR